MTFGEMKTEAFRRLNENSSSPVFWEETDVEAALNEGYEELSDATEWYERHATIDLCSNKPYYDLRTVLTDTFLSPTRAFNNQTNRWLTPDIVRNLDLNTFRQWETITGEPERMFVRGLWWLGYFPKSSSDSGTIKQYYTAIPPPMSAAADEPGFPQEFHYGIVEYGLYDLLAQGGETKKALAHWLGYLGYQEGLQKYVKGRTGLERVGGWRG